MKKTALVLALLASVPVCTASPQQTQTSATPATRPLAAPGSPTLTIEPYTFNGPNGVKIEAEKGTYEVSENRANPKSRKIKIGFVRFKSTSKTPGDPIVYLAGGPGGTGTGAAQSARFPLFMALREVSDVIAFDQRGTGMSSSMSMCRAENPPIIDIKVTRDFLVSFFRKEIARCFDWWESQGVDIDGYTTMENAHDLEDLRTALGARKINLWGISYGSHLGLTMLKYHGGSVNKAVLSGIEGLDQTVKRPALTDKVFLHMQEIIDADPKARALYPDLAGLMRRVVAKLNANPVTGSFTPPNAPAPIKITFDGFAVQLMTSQTTADPSGFANVPLMYYALDHGQYDRVASMLYGPILQQTSGFRGMPEAMDLASGITNPRLALVTEEAKTALLGDALNFPMPQVLGIRDVIDLGDEFRAPFKSNVPALFISATLDGRTYPDEAREEIKGFANKTWLIVENGGHNIYEADKRVANAVVAYFKGKPIPTSIVFDPPKIAMP
ncbi:MAG: alpha/beta fold hydrolase [Alphaproteobacteria bacterium]|nr:alpha/beta fold hydrolase [Alphaproteobacteria bacterium]